MCVIFVKKSDGYRNEFLRAMDEASISEIDLVLKNMNFWYLLKMEKFIWQHYGVALHHHGVEQYLKSLDYFISESISKKVDVALSNHTAIDNGLERILYSKVRMEYMPNIHII